LSEKALAALLAPPEKPDGPPMMAYHKPRDPNNNGDEIVLYELPPDRREGQVIAAMHDGHAQVMTKEEFEKAMK
jgi:hypothetical protein